MTQEERENPEMQLIDSIVTESSIECTKCSKGTITHSEQPEREFYELGWRATPKHAYCPRCAKKYLNTEK